MSQKEGNDMYWEAPKNHDAHIPGIYVESDYTECNGGMKEGYYVCRICETQCYKDGKECRSYYPSVKNHTPGTTKYKANYSVCGGGIKTEYSLCTECGTECLANGLEAIYHAGYSKHTLGSKCEANYKDCNGGFKTVYYECSVCEEPCDANGDDAKYEPPVTDHKLKEVKATEPTYTNHSLESLIPTIKLE